MDQGHGFRVNFPDDWQVLVGTDTGIKTLRNGDICPLGATFLGIRMPRLQASSQREVMPNFGALMFNIGLALAVYKKFGAIGLCVGGVIYFLVFMILSRSLTLAKERAASSAQSSTSTAASSAGRSGPKP